MRRLLDFSFINDSEVLIQGGLEEVYRRMAKLYTKWSLNSSRLKILKLAGLLIDLCEA